MIDNTLIQEAIKAEEEDPSWAIQYNPSLLERKLWERRRVDIYDLDVNDFVEQLRKH